VNPAPYLEGKYLVRKIPTGIHFIHILKGGFLKGAG